jgi:hypothetical protein
VVRGLFDFLDMVSRTFLHAPPWHTRMWLDVQSVHSRCTCAYISSASCLLLQCMRTIVPQLHMHLRMHQCPMHTWCCLQLVLSYSCVACQLLFHMWLSDFVSIAWSAVDTARCWLQVHVTCASAVHAHAHQQCMHMRMPLTSFMVYFLRLSNPYHKAYVARQLLCMCG